MATPGEASFLDVVIPVLGHEYMMAVYGALFWHVEKFFVFVNQAQKHKLKAGAYRRFWAFEWDDIVRSLFWVGVFIAGDDDVMGMYNKWAEQDILSMEPWMYLLAGFVIDSFRKWVYKKANIQEHKIDMSLYK